MFYRSCLLLPGHATLAYAAPNMSIVNEQGWKRPLQWEDFFALPHNLETNRVYPAFESEWRRLLQAAESTPKVACLLPYLISKPAYAVHTSMLTA